MRSPRNCCDIVVMEGLWLVAVLCDVKATCRRKISFGFILSTLVALCAAEW